MGRVNVKDGLAATLRTVNGFDYLSSGTVAIDDHRVLAAGVDRAAIVFTGTGEQARERMGGKTDMTWNLDLEIWIRENNDVVQARQDADVYVQKVIDAINTDGTLGGSAIDALVTLVEPIDEGITMMGGKWLAENLTVKCRESLTCG